MGIQRQKEYIPSGGSKFGEGFIGELSLNRISRMDWISHDRKWNRKNILGGQNGGN